MGTGSTEIKVQALQRRAEEGLGGLEGALRVARMGKGSWNEEDIEYWLHPFLHSLLGYISLLSERLTNIEDLLIKLTEPHSDRQDSIPQADYRTEHDRGESQATIQALEAEDRRIRRLIDLERPISESDRANIGTLILRLRDWNLGLTNELRQLKGESPLPRPTGERTDDEKGPHTDS